MKHKLHKGTVKIVNDILIKLFLYFNQNTFLNEPKALLSYQLNERFRSLEVNFEKKRHFHKVNLFISIYLTKRVLV